MTLGPAVFDRHIAAFDEAGFAQALAKCGGKRSISCWRFTVEKPNHRHRRLLRTRRERPRRRAAEERDEVAPRHSITSLALASKVAGTVMPSILAICALMTNSNLVDCTTGKSAGF